MRFLFTLIIILLFVQLSHAQKGIDGIIKAEKSFAARSVADGTKDAFLKFADSAGIVWSTEVEAPMNAIETWTKREKRPGKLDWQPVYAEIATSQNFGYTTGPYTFIRNDSVLARGEYVTVWKINKNGEWKFVVDLGVNNTPRTSVIHLEKVSVKRISGNATTDKMLKAEEDFITSYKQDRKKAYEKYLSAKSILKRNGRNSATNKELQKKIINDDPQDAGFRILGSGISSSGDIGYVFGNITTGVKQFGYLRIWRKEKTGWKIALEVLRC
jgi:ketosteroid isomerase-like protein